MLVPVGGLWINTNLIEAVYENEDEQTIIQMHSGNVITTEETLEVALAAINITNRRMN